jgi:hypothetical protein
MSHAIVTYHACGAINHAYVQPDMKATLALRTRVGDLEAACAAYKGELELTADELGVESPTQIREAIRQLRAERNAARVALDRLLKTLPIEWHTNPRNTGARNQAIDALETTEAET